MADESIIRTIDTLRAMEGASLLQRLTESASFVPFEEADNYAELQRMADEERQHVRQLEELLDAFHATPGPRHVRAESSSLHYNKPHVLIPRLIADKKHLIAQYEAGAARCAGEPQAADLLAGIIAGHHEHIACLEKLQQAPATG